VTIRDRDSMQQTRVPIAEVGAVFEALFEGTAWSEVTARHGAWAAG